MLLSRRRPPEHPVAGDPLLAQAHADLAWYARIRDRARRWHWTVELTALLTGAGTVVAAGLQAPAAVTASVAGATVFIGGFRQVFNHSERHVLAAEAWSRLRLAVQRYTLVPEAERDEEARRRLLEEIEAVATTELQNWAAARRGTQPGPLPGAHPLP
ncbi:SLATT domain-containing protein [Streptomyces sp. HMX112]|uniref:SLATT domain-containing protein n=1 Tax=Streptomyces sp. HMX112 TaxID=3390850 RepID=UPI003A8048AA